MFDEEVNNHKVPLTIILALTPHSGADRLELATVYGFQVIVRKNQYKVGDPVLYIPIDSVLSEWMEDRLFPNRHLPKEERGVVLHNSRVRQIRLRGQASQGMLIDLKDIKNDLEALSGALVMEKDYSKWLDIKKYEPPYSGFSQTLGKSKQRNKKKENPLFHQYNGLNNIKWFPDLFQEGEEVVIQCKMHGTNARASYVPFIANTLWKRIKKFLGLSPAFEKCYGSNRVEISAKGSSYKGFYGEDLYGATFDKLDVFSKLKPGETVFGEIVGPSIQKNYSYGLSEPKFLLFDVKVLQPDNTQIWLEPEQVEEFAKERGFEMVPVLFKGPFNKDYAYSLTKGPSAFDPKTKVREGIVIKARKGYSVEGNKRAVKWINEQYLDDKSNTEFH